MKSARFIIFGLVFLLCSSSALAQVGSGSATSDIQKPKGSLEVSPAVIEVTLEKEKQEKEIVLTYVNHSKEFVSVELFPIDFKQKDGVGAISFLGQEAGSYSYSLSSFLSFESKTLELEPGERKDFVVKVVNRQDLSPGGHYAAVIAKVVEKDSSEKTTRVAPSISSLILLRKVGGERFNISLTDVSFPRSVVEFSYPNRLMLSFRNEGNVHLVPHGRVEIKDILGRLIYKGAINSGSFRVFPSAIRFIPVDIHAQGVWQLPISINSITINGNDSLRKTTFQFQESYIYVNPLLGVVVIAGVVFAVAWRIRRR